MDVGFAKYKPSEIAQTCMSVAERMSEDRRDHGSGEKTACYDQLTRLVAMLALLNKSDLFDQLYRMYRERGLKGKKRMETAQ